MKQTLIPVMKNEEKILVLLAEVLQKVDVLSVEVNGIKGEIRGIKDEITDIKDEITGIKDDVKDLKDNVVKLNIISAENSRALMKLADNTEGRLSRLEKAVFK
jgi:archaellum component FlaC